MSRKKQSIEQLCSKATSNYRVLYPSSYPTISFQAPLPLPKNVQKGAPRPHFTVNIGTPNAPFTQAQPFLQVPGAPQAHGAQGQTLEKALEKLNSFLEMLVTQQLKMHQIALERLQKAIEESR